MTMKAILAWVPEHSAALNLFYGLQSNVLRCSANGCIYAGGLGKCSCGLKMATRHRGRWGSSPGSDEVLNEEEWIPVALNFQAVAINT